MCIFGTPKTPPPPPIPAEPQQAKPPNEGDVRKTTGARVQDQLRSQAATVLTGGQGVTTSAPTAGKTLLGQ